jgi:tight adherence protein B
VRITPSAVVLISVMGALMAGLITYLLLPLALVALLVAVGAAFAPFGFLLHRRGRRLKRFEEMFPEALDLLSRAIRAGHAFQTAMGMVADELPEPVGPEFKKTFDQQNFGLPLRDALNELSERIHLLDVRFFVTAVLIQRDTGGNLSEILDNLAHVVASASRSSGRFASTPRTDVSPATCSWHCPQRSRSRCRSSTLITCSCCFTSAWDK